jgi:6-phosphogluconolactonase
MALLNWTVRDDPDAVAHHACARIMSHAEESIRERGTFSIVLAGGNTPAAAYELLARQDCEWSKWHVWFGDERCLPVNDNERNSSLAQRTLIDKVSIPKDQVHVIPAELGPDRAAAEYSRMLDDHGVFDLVLLGMGEDGHTASLFPGKSYPAADKAVPVHDAPKPPPDRVSLSYSTLSNCRHLVIIVTGANKAAAVRLWRTGNALPVSNVTSLVDSEVIIDRNAMSDPGHGYW